MKRYLPLLILASLLSFSSGALLPPLFAAPPHIQSLPIVRNGAQPPAQTALIYECQCGAVIATVLPDGRVLLTILDHSRGGAVVVGIDNGGGFQEIEGAVPAPAGIAPAFQFPGEKQGIGSTVPAFGGLVTYAPSRTEEGGRYNVWRFVYPGP